MDWVPKILTIDCDGSTWQQKNWFSPTTYLSKGGRNNAFYTNAFLPIRNNEFLKIQVNLRILRIRNNEFYLSTPMPNEFHQNRTKNSLAKPQ